MVKRNIFFSQRLSCAKRAIGKLMAGKRYFKEGDYFAFYVDLMGQKNLYDKLASWPNVAPETRGAVASTNGITHMAFNYIGEFIERYKRDSLAAFGYLKHVRSYAGLTYFDFLNMLYGLQYGTQQFSDSLVFYLRDEGKISLDIFVYCVQVLELVLNRFLSTQVAFRAVIGYGKGWEQNVNSFTGPLLTELMTIEETKVGHPRVSVTPDFYDYCQGKSGDTLVSALLNRIEKRDAELYSLDRYSKDLCQALTEEEKKTQGNLLKAEQYFLSKSYSIFLDNSPKIASKYEKAAKEIAGKLPIWEDVCHNAGQRMGCEALMPNIQDYEVFRVAFSNKNKPEIAISQDMSNFRIELLSNIGLKLEYLISNVFATVLIFGIESTDETFLLRKEMRDKINKEIPKWQKQGYSIEGSSAIGKGWMIGNKVTLCGPVMMKVYKDRANIPVGGILK